MKKYKNDIMLLFSISQWIMLFVSSILGAIAIYIGVKITREPPHIFHAFLVALTANILTWFGIAGLIASYLPIPYAYLFAQLIVWIILIKLFYRPLYFSHTIAIGAIAFLLMLLVNYACIMFRICPEQTVLRLIGL